PRTSTSRSSAVPPESDLATSDQQADAIARDAAAESDARDTPEAPESVQPAAPPPAAAAAARLTPAEVLAAGKAFSHQHEDGDQEEVAPSTKASVPIALKAVEAPVVARVEAPVVARVEASVVAKAAEAPKKAEPVVVAKKAEPVVVAKKAEPVAVTKKAEEPRKVESPQSQGNARKGEPVKAAPAKKADVGSPPRSERAAPADEAPRSVNNVNKKKGSKGEGAKAEARRPTDDEVDTSSISAEFFLREGDSLPPLVGAHEELEEHDEPGAVHHVLSPAAIARQARLRRLVAGVVAFAGVITLAVVGKTLAASKQPTASVPVKPPVVQEAKVDPKPEEKAAPAPVKTVAAPVEAPKASAEVAKAEPDPKAEARAAEDAKKAEEEAKKAEEPKKAEPSGGDAKALTKEAEAFLNRGNRKDAIVKAREAIAADPSQAMPYLYLGSALQDSGKWKDGIEAYSECVRNATKGPVNECKQMGGHK
ncbi:MAG: hypothetical protein ABI134_00335, partial [Byssovorax sp.]